jgi:hypothetical protein
VVYEPRDISATAVVDDVGPLLFGVSLMRTRLFGAELGAILNFVDCASTGRLAKSK